MVKMIQRILGLCILAACCAGTLSALELPIIQANIRLAEANMQLCFANLNSDPEFSQLRRHGNFDNPAFVELLDRRLATDSEVVAMQKYKEGARICYEQFTDKLGQISPTAGSLAKAGVSRALDAASALEQKQVTWGEFMKRYRDAGVAMRSKISAAKETILAEGRAAGPLPDGGTTSPVPQAPKNDYSGRPETGLTLAQNPQSRPAGAIDSVASTTTSTNACEAVVESNVTVTRIRAALATGGKGEYETTAQYEERFLKLFSDRTLIAHYPYSEQSSKYDADSQTLTLSRNSLPIDFFHMMNILKGFGASYEGASLNSVVLNRGSYVGQNSFGAKTVVERTSKSDVGILWPSRGLRLTPSNDIAISVPIKDAPAVRKRIQIQFVGTLLAPYVISDTHFSEATLDLPTELRSKSEGVVVTPVCGLVYDGLTKTIYSRLSFMSFR